MSDFQSVARFDELPLMGGKEVIVEGIRICLFKQNGRVFAMAAECPHKGAPLATGWLENGQVFCSLHGWEFELETGHCATNPACPVKTFPVRVINGDVQLSPTGNCVP